MPSKVTESSGITKLTNCRLLNGINLTQGELWVSSKTGKIVDAQSAFFDHHLVPDKTIDLGNRILSPGLIDTQLNGAFGFNFSTLISGPQYIKKLAEVNRQLVKTGVTSYVPTLTSQLPELYQSALPHLAPAGTGRSAKAGSESLGAHVEGPFLSNVKNGVHNKTCFQSATSFSSLEDCYGAENLTPMHAQISANGASLSPTIRMITAAPEVGNMKQLIPEIVSRGIVYSIGHSAATYDQAIEAMDAGATMVTHLFNAMLPLHHREPGIVGILGGISGRRKPSYGVISDGVHLHPATVALAYRANHEGFILVTDAMHLVGCPDGAYEFRNGEEVNNIVKRGTKLLLEGSETIAGSSITLLECVNNFLEWTGVSAAEALNAVTATPAKMLGLGDVKGSLKAGADADLIVFSEAEGQNGATLLKIDEVWKFGERVE